MVYFRKMRVYVVLLQLFYLVESSSNINLPYRPWNMAVTVGQRFQMKCEPDNNNNISNTSKISEWTIHKPLNNDKRSIWTNWKDETKTRNATFNFDVDNDGSVTIKSKSIRLEDAGIYTCVVDKTPKQPERYSAQLIVFESDPQCNTSISVTDGSIEEFDSVTFRCAVNYSGHWNPSMQWSKDGNALNKEASVSNINMPHDAQQLESVINWQVNAEDNDAMITCKTFFNETTENVNKTSARNVPEYRFYCNRTLAVLFGPRNVTITPKKDLYQDKDVISCKAFGNPSPSYTWRNLTTKEEIADGPQLALNEVGLKANGRYVIECVAQNKVSGEIKQSSATIDIIITGNSGNPIMIILAGIICAILLLIVIIVGREHIKGWITKLLSVCRRGPSNEPDILPNDDNIQNGVAFNNDIQPYGHYAAPADNLAFGNARKQRDENATGNQNEEATGSSANLFHATMDKTSPVYSEINKPKNNDACNTYSRGVGEKATSPAYTSFGRDGTLYTEVNLNRGLHQSEASGSMHQHSMFNKSEYARIDNTEEPPPPPIPKRK